MERRIENEEMLMMFNEKEKTLLCALRKKSFVIDLLLRILS